MNRAIAFFLFLAIVSSACIGANQAGSQGINGGAAVPPSEILADNSTNPVPAAGTSANTVSITASGFVPSTITISAGETVTWTNDDAVPHWVASNPHPTHTDYSGFDAKRNIQPVETYSFKFTKTGLWSYHDHLNPSKGGTVIVK